MRLADLVRIDSRFDRSVNLLLDLHNEEKLRLYIPTRSSINLIMSYLQEVTDFHGDRASILIGPYGKGKSHLLLVLLSLLSGRDSVEIRDLINRIGSIDGDAAAKIAAVNRDKKFLPVVINTSSGDLGQAFVKSLIRTLKSEGMDDVVPDSYFSEAVRIIRLWEESFPDTYSALQKMLADISIEMLIDDLERMDHDSLAMFRNLYPRLTSGSEFNPSVEDDVIPVYRSVNRVLCTRYGFSGIYIIFDEFSKYIEGHTEEGFSADMKVLQDICELCNSSVEEQFHLTCVAHKAIRSYGDLLSRSVRNAFRGVEGRLKEIRFVVSSQNNYELVADAIRKTEVFDSWKKDPEFTRFISESYRVAEFPALFNKDDYAEIIGAGAFPLTPISAMLLLNICEKIAQNERTIFTFITEDDVHSLSSFVKRSDKVEFAGADLIYDYFSGLMETDKNSEIHTEWLKAEYALAQTQDSDERKVIKALAVMRMANLPDILPAVESYLYMSLGTEKDNYKNALKRLEDAGLVTLKKVTGAFEFKSSIGIDVDNKLADCAARYFKNVDIAALLNDVNRMPYILPKKYNQEYCMTRYFSVRVIRADAFMALSSASYLSSEHEPDGYLLLVLCNNNDEAAEIRKHTVEMGDPTVITCCAVISEEHTDEARMFLSCRKLLEDEVFIEENDIVLPELRKMEVELADNLGGWASSLFNSISKVYTNTGELAVGDMGLNRVVSDICSIVYNETPVINHELINRHNISAQVSKARNTIIDDILHFRDPSKYMAGTSAESTVYRAVKVHTADDPNLKRIRAEIISFIHESKGNKVPFSKLFGVLTSPPIGMRRGVIPIYIAEQLTALEDMPVVYQGRREISIDPQLLANIASSPEDYALYVEEGTIEKLEYIEGLEKLFADYELYCRDIEQRNRLSRLTCIMQAWYRSLPQTSVTYKKPDDESQDMQKIIRFRKLFSDNPNPRELIFEKIPQIFGNVPLSDVLEAVIETKKTIDDHIHNLKKAAENAVRTALGLAMSDDFYRSLKAWYEAVPDKTKRSVLSSDSQRIFNTIRDLSITDNEEITEQISKAAVNFFIEDWRDETIDDFSAALYGMVEEISEIGKRPESEMERISFSDGGTSDERLIDFDPENLSSTGHFFQNALDDVLEEYGDTLETSEKIGILMNLVRKLMG